MGRWMQYNGLSFTECRFEGGHGKILRLGDNKLKLTRHQIWYPAGEFFFHIKGRVHPSDSPSFGWRVGTVFRMSFTATEYFCLLFT